MEREERINEFYHYSYKELESKFNKTDKMIMLLGPVHCGKQYSVRQLCFKKAKIFYSNILIVDKKDLLGYFNGQKEYEPSELFMAYSNGEVFYIDELSHCSKDVLKELIKINKSTSYKFPCGKVKKHKNFRIIVSVNERNFDVKNRFISSNFEVIFYNYDQELEKRLCPDEQLYEFISSVRKLSDEQKVCSVVTSNTFRKYYNILSLGYFTPLDLAISILRTGQYYNILQQMISEYKESLASNIYFKQLIKIANR